MRIIASENVSATVIRALREQGHDVVSVKESTRAASDDAVLQRAAHENRLVITHDKDFEALAFRWGLPAAAGVILFRLAGTDPDADNQRVLRVPGQRMDWADHFSVVTGDRMRMRSLPGRES